MSVCLSVYTNISTIYKLDNVHVCMYVCLRRIEYECRFSKPYAITNMKLKQTESERESVRVQFAHAYTPSNSEYTAFFIVAMEYKCVCESIFIYSFVPNSLSMPEYVYAEI